MSAPKTHRERASKTVEALRRADCIGQGAMAEAHGQEIIARETFPRELVEAAERIAMNAELAPDPRMDDATDIYLVPAEDLDALRDALSLYPEEF